MQRLNIEGQLENNSEANRDMALDFICFQLRYHQHMTYEDFTDHLHLQNLIKRAETFRIWTDLEDQALQLHNLTTMTTDLEKRLVNLNLGNLPTLHKRIEALELRTEQLSEVNVTQPSHFEDTINIIKALKAEFDQFQSEIENRLQKMPTGGGSSFQPL
jgi:hypothetical protein